MDAETSREICSYCGDGCQITDSDQEQELIEVNSLMEPGETMGTCALGDFSGYHATSHPDRLTHPLIRREGLLVPLPGRKHLEYVAGSVKPRNGPMEAESSEA